MNWALLETAARSNFSYHLDSLIHQSTKLFFLIVRGHVSLPERDREEEGEGKGEEESTSHWLCGHAVIPSALLLQPIRIWGAYAHVAGMFFKPPGLGFNPGQPCRIQLP